MIARSRMSSDCLPERQRLLTAIPSADSFNLRVSPTHNLSRGPDLLSDPNLLSPMLRLSVLPHLPVGLRPGLAHSALAPLHGSQTSRSTLNGSKTGPQKQKTKMMPWSRTRAIVLLLLHQACSLDRKLFGRTSYPQRWRTCAIITIAATKNGSSPGVPIAARSVGISLMSTSSSASSVNCKLATGADGIDFEAP